MFCSLDLYTLLSLVSSVIIWLYDWLNFYIYPSFSFNDDMILIAGWRRVCVRAATDGERIHKSQQRVKQGDKPAG